MVAWHWEWEQRLQRAVRELSAVMEMFYNWIVVMTA